ncbi:hypothetical protein BDR06DRAFT_1015411 [Suillus hirtellus]|nr:hypothetical protein BDR06DRAFT_1015411 [Suillus hirtellus]
MQQQMGSDRRKEERGQSTVDMVGESGMRAYTSVVAEISISYRTAATIDAKENFHLKAEWREELTMPLDDVKAEGKNPKEGVEGGKREEGEFERARYMKYRRQRLSARKIKPIISEKETQQDRPKDMVEVSNAFNKLPEDDQGAHQWQIEGENPVALLRRCHLRP